MNHIIKIFFVFLVLLITCTNSYSTEQSNTQINKEARCAVCGMFVAKYPAWITKVVHKDSTIRYFDGVKDMMAYFLEPEKYGSTPKNTITEIFIKDYYSLNWQSAKSAFFVKGSDVYGPMGHELIPFSSNEAAVSFSKDHHGKGILKFEDVTFAIINAMRSGHRMK